MSTTAVNIKVRLIDRVCTVTYTVLVVAWCRQGVTTCSGFDSLNDSTTLIVNSNRYVMSNYKKSRLHWGKYLTRKDWHHIKPDCMWSYYRKKPLRRHANGLFRRYTGDVQDGGWYKKVFDLPWTLY